MKAIKAYIAAILLAGTCAVPSSHAAEIWSESFETDGEGVRYTSNIEFKDLSANAFFLRSNNSQSSGQTIPNGGFAGSQDRRYGVGGGPFTGLDGTWVWAADNVDGTNSAKPLPASVTLNTVNVSLHTNLVFSGLFGAVLADDDDFMRLSYSLNGGGFVQALYFAATNATGNSQGFALDTNNDGVGDPGISNTNMLSVSLKAFSFSIPNTNTVQIKIEVSANSSNDEFGFDFFRITGDALIPEPSTAAFLFFGLSMLGWRIKRK